VCFAILAYDVIAHSLARMTGGTPVAPGGRKRMAVALSFFAVDALLKAFTLEPVRRALASNLIVK
jgi:hypothetical protein